MFERVAIIGLGLIGSSLAYGIKHYKLAKHVTGVDTNPLHGELLTNKRIIDDFHTSIEETTSNHELIILATPPQTIETIAAQLSPLLATGTLLIDTTSTKQDIIAALIPHLPPTAVFIPTHPIAGSEQSGASAGHADLFKNRRVIMTPLQETPEQAIHLMNEFWQSLGAVCDSMPPDTHDIIYAYMSHTPHLIAYCMAETISEYQIDKTELLQKTLRIAGSSPSLWTHIIKSNASNVMKSLEQFLHVLSQIIAELQSHENIDFSIKEENAENIATLLFPRIAASCLISTITICEKREQLPLARYGGPGFLDLVSSVQTAPEEDIETISNLHRQVAALLTVFDTHLRHCYGLIAEKNWDALEATFLKSQQSWIAMNRQ